MRDDDAPLTSYSDPFYDRLDALSRQVRRLWWLFALAVIAIALAAIALRLWLHREPTALGGAMALRAIQERDPAAQERLWADLADGAANDPAFRAAAAIELAQLQLAKGNPISARERAELAEAQAKAAGDTDLILAAGLSKAAALTDLGDREAALALYDRIAGSAGAKHPARRIAAELGAAVCLDKLGRRDEAIARLEPLSQRTDRGADQVVLVATSMYWRLKREAVPAPVAAPAPAPAPAAQPEAPKAP
jgi:hypothetical protein